MDGKYTESVWRRGWEDTKSGFGHWLFWVFEFFGAGVAGMIWDALAVLVVGVGMIGCLWVGATVSAPFRQRDEARELCGELKVGNDDLKTKFCELEERSKELQHAMLLAGIGSLAGTGSKQTIQAIVSCEVSNTIEIVDSEGVSSVTDHGYGDFGVNLQKNIDPSRARIIPLNVTPAFDVMSVDNSGFRIRFDTSLDEEPKKFGILLEAPLAKEA